MFVHSVYFWLKKDLEASQREDLRTALKALKSIESLQSIWVGDPAASERPVVDSSYDIGLVTIFENAAGHAAYQSHAAHQAFLEKYNACWDKAAVYDFAADD